MPADTSTADRIQIADLFTRFALLLDTRRYDDADTVFTDDVQIHGPRGDLGGFDTVVEFLRRAHVDGEHTQHLTTDLLVDLDGDHAAGSANSLVYFYRDGNPPHRISGLRLTCTAVRTPAGWRLRESRTTLLWMREH
ncbi:nuclear transport factor 2 family protein [Nocardia higoensis]|uniref:Nuclear transport factor 2 family protein n=1 Tax=Nocardia higoensis TaxID=228599 RepID=A0ABS0D7E9_9NOCA|nr:nuclear transport factor 2 family protein [Nocardia higoensis]MBF6353582.1 nuclear transport factor 2 family protein [Nocardia higoensis]